MLSTNFQNMKYQKRVHWDRHRPEFLKIGFIFALAIAFMAFNYTTDPPKITPFIDDYEIEDFIITPPPTVHQKKIVPPTPPPKINTIVEIEPTIEPILKFEKVVEFEKEVETVIDEYANDPIPEPAPMVMPIKEEIPEDNAPLLIAERMPIYGSCDVDSEEKEIRDCTNHNLIMHIYNNVKYPALAREYGVQGTVVVSFIVNKQGFVEDVKIVRGVGSGCGEEVERVIKKLGRFLPGKQNGRPVSVIYRLPVKFSLE